MPAVKGPAVSRGPCRGSQRAEEPGWLLDTVRTRGSPELTGALWQVGTHGAAPGVAPWGESGQREGGRDGSGRERQARGGGRPAAPVLLSERGRRRSPAPFLTAVLSSEHKPSISKGITQERVPTPQLSRGRQAVLGGPRLLSSPASRPLVTGHRAWQCRWAGPQGLPRAWAWLHPPPLLAGRTLSGHRFHSLLCSCCGFWPSDASTMWGWWEGGACAGRKAGALAAGPDPGDVARHPLQRRARLDTSAPYA